MGHDHDHHRHDHSGHSHAIRADADRRPLTIALLLISSMVGLELVVGIAVGSLALISDAAHMLTDALAIALALVAARLAQRPAGGVMTFGLGRVEILSAQFNGATLLILGLFILYEGIRRLFDPPDVPGIALLVVALIGVVVNLLATVALARANRESLNIEGAYQHVLTDLFAFVATAVAGIVIMLTGWVRADGVAALFVAAIMLHSAYGLLRASGRIFLEAAPSGVDPEALGRSMLQVEGVREVHDLHVWEVTSGFVALSAHVLVAEEADCHAARRELELLVHHTYEIEHTTLQVEHEGSELLSIEPFSGASGAAPSAARPPRPEASR